MSEANDSGEREKRQLEGEQGQTVSVPAASREPHPPREDEEAEEEEPKLPMSKARCIALVITLAGAAFLNVRDPLGSFLSFSFLLSFLVPHPPLLPSIAIYSPLDPNP